MKNPLICAAIAMVLGSMLACGESHDAKDGLTDTERAAAVAAGKSVVEKARERATERLASTTDWSDAAGIGMLCEHSDLSKVTPGTRSRCASAHLTVMRDSLKAKKVADARKAFDLASVEGLSPVVLASSAKLLKTAEDADLQRKREAAATTNATARRQYGQLLRQRYLDENMDIKVSVTGKGNDHLTLKFVLFNDVWANKVTQGTLLTEMAALGFHRVDMTDGYDYNMSWTVK